MSFAFTFGLLLFFQYHAWFEKHGVIEQIRRYPANEKWIAISKDAFKFYNSLDDNELLFRAKKYNIGVLVISSGKKVQVVLEAKEEKTKKHTNYLNYYVTCKKIEESLNAALGNNPNEINSMPTTYYNKLIRDKIPEIIEKSGKRPITEILDDKSYKKHLDIKLSEELQEYLNDDNISELADLVEVIYAILKYKGIEPDEKTAVRVVICTISSSRIPVEQLKMTFPAKGKVCFFYEPWRGSW